MKPKFVELRSTHLCPFCSDLLPSYFLIMVNLYSNRLYNGLKMLWYSYTFECLWLIWTDSHSLLFFLDMLIMHVTIEAKFSLHVVTTMTFPLFWLTFIRASFWFFIPQIIKKNQAPFAFHFLSKCVHDRLCASHRDVFLAILECFLITVFCIFIKCILYTYLDH